MFKILDGREAFFQWDLNQKLIVEDASINEVHFSNHSDDDALVVEVVDGMVDVPNIMLQENWRLKVYAYSVDHTKVEQVFNVQKRAKPTDYIYTETEIKDYDDLVARIDEIELNGVSQEAIEKAVELYLDANPVEPGATTEEAAQIEQNKQDIAGLTDALGEYALKTDIPDTSGLATEEYVDQAIGGIVHPTPDLSSYATKEEVNTAIEQIELTPGPQGEPGKDGENYILTEADKQEIATLINAGVDVEAWGGSKIFWTHDTQDKTEEALNSYARYAEAGTTTVVSYEVAPDGFETAKPGDLYIQLCRNTSRNGARSYIIHYIETITHAADRATYTYNFVDVVHSGSQTVTGGGADVDLSNYYTKSETDALIPDTTGLATTNYVDEKISSLDIPEAVDLSNYALKSEIPDVSQFRTEEEIIALIGEYAVGGDVPNGEGVEF